MVFVGLEMMVIFLLVVFYFLYKILRVLVWLLREIDDVVREGRFLDYEIGLVIWYES